MLNSRAKILANLKLKENTPENSVKPCRKLNESGFPQKSSNDVSPLSQVENIMKKRAVDTFDPQNVDIKSLFTKKTSNKIPKKHTLQSNFCEDGKENEATKLAVKNETKKKEKFNNLDIFHEEVKEAKNRGMKENDVAILSTKEAPERYWELMAEERRKALEIALIENKQLADEIKAKNNLIEELQTEIQDLKETLKHAENVSSILEDLVNECNSDLDGEEKIESTDSVEGKFGKKVFPESSTPSNGQEFLFLANVKSNQGDGDRCHKGCFKCVHAYCATDCSCCAKCTGSVQEMPAPES